MTISGGISHPATEWSDYPPPSHTDKQVADARMRKIFMCQCAIFLFTSDLPYPETIGEIPQLSSAERLKVNIWKYEASMCVCVSLSPSVSRPVCFQMIKQAHGAAGEPTPTWGPCGEVLDLAREEQEALSEAWVTTKTSAAQRTLQREREGALISR